MASEKLCISFGEQERMWITLPSVYSVYSKFSKWHFVLCFNSLRYDYFIIIINFNEWFPSEINKGTENLGVIQTLPTGALLTGRRKAQHITADFMGGGRF